MAQTHVCNFPSKFQVFARRGGQRSQFCNAPGGLVEPQRQGLCRRVKNQAECRKPEGACATEARQEVSISAPAPPAKPSGQRCSYRVEVQHRAPGLMEGRK